MIFLIETFWQKLEEWDKWLFLQINNNWSNSFFDAVMPFMRNPFFWVPLYLFIFLFVSLNYKTKGIWWMVVFLSTVALTDITGTYLFKNTIQRMRPCADPDIAFQVRLLLKQCGGYSFVSNHAANHFGMATFFFFTFRHVLKKWVWVPYAWATIIIYSQVYVGVHYPSDVICGALLGFVFGFASAAFFNKRFGFAIFDNQPTA